MRRRTSWYTTYMGIFNFLKSKSYSDELKEQSLVPPLPSSTELMIIEDVFRITDRGTIVSGKASAPMHKGQSVIVRSTSGDVYADIAELEVKQKSTGDVQPGDSVAILLADVDSKQLRRGGKVFSD